jgi:hypothetical protein
MRSKDGSLRGKVLRINTIKNNSIPKLSTILPKQSKTNDRNMSKQIDNLYGNTRLTDEQFCYFYVKYKGCIGQMKVNELNWVSLPTLYNRAADLKLPCIGVGGTHNIDIKRRVEIFRSIVDHGKTYTKIAKELGISRKNVERICNNIGIAEYKSIGMSNKMFKTIYVNLGRNKSKMAKLTKLSYGVIYAKCKKLEL